MTLRPFYLPREFGCVLLFVVYAPPSGNAKRAAATVADCVHTMQQQHPEAPAIVVGDMNQCKLDLMMPGFKQYIKGGTRKNKLLDKCFVNVEGAYVSRIRPPIGTSDHNVVHLVPAYKSKLKRFKPEKKVVKVWSPDNIEKLKASYDCTMWEVFHHDSLDETTTVTTDYTDFCVQSVIPTREIKIYPNNKTFITKEVKHIINL